MMEEGNKNRSGAKSSGLVMTGWGGTCKEEGYMEAVIDCCGTFPLYDEIWS